MSNIDKIIDFLQKNEKGCYCDDCLCGLLKICPRQQVNQICRRLADDSIIDRLQSRCTNCSKYKIVNSNKHGLIPSLKTSKQTRMNISSKGKRLHYNEFEIRVSKFLNNKFKQRFFEQSIEVGSNKYHKFDLVSEDGNIVAECKSYTWTESGNYPQAKISTAIETLFYFSRIKADKKILIFQDDINAKGESLVDVFVRRNAGIFEDIEVWAYNVKGNVVNDEIRIVRKR